MYFTRLWDRALKLLTRIDRHVDFRVRRNWARAEIVKWNGIFRAFRFFGILGQPPEVVHNFRNEFPETFCSIWFCTGISGNFGQMDRARYVLGFEFPTWAWRNRNSTHLTFAYVSAILNFGYTIRSGTDQPLQCIFMEEVLTTTWLILSHCFSLYQNNYSTQCWWIFTSQLRLISTAIHLHFGE